MDILHHAESVLQTVIQFGILLLECTGVCVLLVAAIKSIIGYIGKDPHVRLTLAQGTALALGFKLGGEVLRTVIIREWSELLILGAIIVLRGAMALLIHWEIKNEEERIAVGQSEGGTGERQVGAADDR